MLADIKGPHLDFWGGANSFSHGSGYDIAQSSLGGAPKLWGILTLKM